MTLSEPDQKLFYKMFFPLLDYVNDHYHVVPDAPKMSGAESVNPNLAYNVGKHLWTHTDIIDEYLADNPDLPEDEREIISSWKRAVFGSFVVERHLKKGTALLSSDNDCVYMVIGIVSEWEELIPFPPAMIETALLPFRGRIINASLFQTYRITFGGGMKRGFREEYMEAKRAGRIYTSL